MEEQNNYTPDVIESKSTVKLIKNTRGLNWEIKVVAGTTTEEIEQLRKMAMLQHKILYEEFEE